MIILRLLFLLVALGACSAAYNFLVDGQWMAAIILGSIGMWLLWLAWLLGDRNGEMDDERHPNESIFKLVYIHYGFALFASCAPSLDVRWFSAGMGVWLLYLIYMIYHFKFKKDFRNPETFKQIHIRTWSLFTVFAAFIPIKIFGVWGDWNLGGWAVVCVLGGFYWYFRKNPSKAVSLLQNPNSAIIRLFIPAAVISAVSKSLLHSHNFALGWHIASVFFLLFALFFIVISQAARLGPLNEVKPIANPKKKKHEQK